METLCLFLKPQVSTPEDLEKQNHYIKMIISPAIAHAGLSVIDNQIDGLEVADISGDVIRKIFKADVLVIDANWYPTSRGLYQFSPFLYYYMAIGQSRGNATILLTETTLYLSRALVRHHAFTYSLADSRVFTRKFTAAVNEIRQQQNWQPDNPIQDCLQQEKALMQAHQQRTVLKANKVWQKQDKRQPFIFRPVEEEWK